tara:strand:+ start:224 stop:784 length:561 start_codon:yes stop_codon:yes gene_type:complete
MKKFILDGVVRLVSPAIGRMLKSTGFAKEAPAWQAVGNKTPVRSYESLPDSVGKKIRASEAKRAKEVRAKMKEESTKAEAAQKAREGEIKRKTPVTSAEHKIRRESGKAYEETMKTHGRLTRNIPDEGIDVSKRLTGKGETEKTGRVKAVDKLMKGTERKKGGKVGKKKSSGKHADGNKLVASLYD